MSTLTESLIRKVIKAQGFKVIKKGEVHYEVQPIKSYHELFRGLPRNTKLVCINDSVHEYGRVVYLNSMNLYTRISLSEEPITNDTNVYRETFSRHTRAFIPFEWLFPKKNHLPNWF